MLAALFFSFREHCIFFVESVYTSTLLLRFVGYTRESRESRGWFEADGTIRPIL